MEHIRQVRSTEVDQLKLKCARNHFKSQRIKCSVQNYDDCQVR